MIAVYCEKHVKPTNAIREQNAELMNVKAGANKHN
jgi:hypothetical protein